MFSWENGLDWSKSPKEIANDIRKNQENLTVKQMIDEIEPLVDKPHCWSLTRLWAILHIFADRYGENSTYGYCMSKEKMW